MAPLVKGSHFLRVTYLRETFKNPKHSNENRSKDVPVPFKPDSELYWEKERLIKVGL